MKRGGFLVISHKYAKANNPYLPNYNPEEPNEYLLQLDVNSLYSYAMCQMQFIKILVGSKRKIYLILIEEWVMEYKPLS